MAKKTKIIIYGAKDCPWTTKIIDLLEEKDIKDYEFKDIVHNLIARQEMYDKAGYYSTPVIDINGQIIQGMDIKETEKVLAVYSA